MVEVKVSPPICICHLLRCQCGRHNIFKAKNTSGKFHLSKSGLQVLENTCSGAVIKGKEILVREGYGGAGCQLGKQCPEFVINSCIHSFVCSSFI